MIAKGGDGNIKCVIHLERDGEKKSGAEGAQAETAQAMTAQVQFTQASGEAV